MLVAALPTGRNEFSRSLEFPISLRKNRLPAIREITPRGENAMRKWIIGGVVVLLVLVIVVGVALVSLNGLIDRNKEYILAQVKEAVGRDVTVGDIGVSL